jgi:O-antigen/teichoic acid export membrane protein|tara:strand:+ start:785 stop:2068 length:1284 start_codon:yes stop_codon:yes gene_type:complete
MLTKKRINAIIDLLKDKNQRKSFYYVLIRGVSVISNYFFSILIITLFSKEDYGFFVFGLSLFMMLSVLTKFGVDVHFVKVFSKFKDREVPNWVKTVELKVFSLSFIIAITISTFLYLFRDNFDSWLALVLFVISAPFYVAILMNSGKLRGVSKISRFAFLNIAGRILLSLCFFVILFYGFSFRSYFIIYLSHLLSVFFLLILSIYWKKQAFVQSKNKSKLVPASFLKYNRALMIKSYITVLFLWGDRFFLSLICSPAEVAEYDVSLKIAMLLMIVIEALKSTYASVFAKNTEIHKVLNIQIRKSTRLGFLFSSLMFILIVLFGSNLLFLFGPDFVDSYTTLLIISLGYLIASFFGQADNVLEMCGLAPHFVKPYFIIITTSLAAGVLLSLFFGAIGMAIGFAAGNVSFQLVASQIVKYKLGIKTSFL